LARRPGLDYGGGAGYLELAGKWRERRARTMTAMTETVLDTKGLNCPLPVLRVKKAMKDVPAGGVLKVLATDPGAVTDVEAFCQATGNQLLNSNQESGVFVFKIRKSA
jgi:tRNA 2-thiouridine synthesizing protein A